MMLIPLISADKFEIYIYLVVSHSTTTFRVGIQPIVEIINLCPILGQVARNFLRYSILKGSNVYCIGSSFNGYDPEGGRTS